MNVNSGTTTARGTRATGGMTTARGSRVTGGATTATGGTMAPHDSGDGRHDDGKEQHANR